ncbi:MAG: GGDEF domain-containing protein, partial [Clostridia bacterium]
INDTYGHDVGDNVLDIIAKRLVKVLPENSIICRIGGDEFVAMIPNDYGPEALEKIGQDTLAAISMKIPKAGTNINITASIGFCIYPHDGADIEELLRIADKAMYRVKEKDKNGYNIYS